MRHTMICSILHLGHGSCFSWSAHSFVSTRKETISTTPTGYQALLMAPTELLAEQHYEKLLAVAEDMPMSLRPRIELVVASIKAKVRSWAVPWTSKAFARERSGTLTRLAGPQARRRTHSCGRRRPGSWHTGAAAPTVGSPGPGGH